MGGGYFKFPAAIWVVAGGGSSAGSGYPTAFLLGGHADCSHIDAIIGSGECGCVRAGPGVRALSPILASAAMVFSSVSVVTNSLRLRGARIS